MATGTSSPPFCLATRWPEAVPLWTITARAVVEGLFEIFSRTGLPLTLLSDQGSQFVGAMMGRLCKELGVDRLKTTPYHPQANGVLERMHGTLGPMLCKAVEVTGDWGRQLHFAMFALRSLPHRDTGLSPYELVYGVQARTPLDAIHHGWTQEDCFKLEVGEWAEWLRKRVEVLRAVAGDRLQVEADRRRLESEKKGRLRVFEAGDKVWVRVPGIDSNYPKVGMVLTL